MSFLDEFRKFLGGIVGDERTNAGIAINRAEHENEPTRFAKTRAVPFSYDDNGTVRAGFLKVPSYSLEDINDALSRQQNAEAIKIYGIELDDGTNLDYDEAKNFLNKYTPDTLKLSVDKSVRKPGNEKYLGNPTYLENLRSAMRYYSGSPRYSKYNTDGILPDFSSISGKSKETWGK